MATQHDLELGVPIKMLAPLVPIPCKFLELRDGHLAGQCRLQLRQSSSSSHIFLVKGVDLSLKPILYAFAAGLLRELSRGARPYQWAGFRCIHVKVS